MRRGEVGFFFVFIILLLFIWLIVDAVVSKDKNKQLEVNKNLETIETMTNIIVTKTELLNSVTVERDKYKQMYLDKSNIECTDNVDSTDIGSGIDVDEYSTVETTDDKFGTGY